MEIYLGYPRSEVKNWIKDNFIREYCRINLDGIFSYTQTSNSITITGLKNSSTWDGSIPKMFSKKVALKVNNFQYTSGDFKFQYNASNKTLSIVGLNGSLWTTSIPTTKNNLNVTSVSSFTGRNNNLNVYYPGGIGANATITGTQSGYVFGQTVPSYIGNTYISNKNFNFSYGGLTYYYNNGRIYDKKLEFRSNGSSVNIIGISPNWQSRNSLTIENTYFGRSIGTISKSVFDSYKVELVNLTINCNLSKLPDNALFGLKYVNEIYFGNATINDIKTNANKFGIGKQENGSTNIVNCWCADGVVVINGKLAEDSSSSDGGNDWDGLVSLLENYPNAKGLPKVGSLLTVPYKVDMNAKPVNSKWEILGYNTSIPEYIKYKNGEDRIYVSSLKDGLLHTIESNDIVYIKDGDSFVANGKTVSNVVGVVNNINGHTYGNNCPYDAPMIITVDGTEYTFAGYNCTIMSKYALVCKYNGQLLAYPQFDSNRNGYGQNDWSTSMLREWMNNVRLTNQGLNKQYWYDDLQNSSITGNNIEKLPKRLTDNKFKKHVMSVVNRTWVYSKFRTGKTLDTNYCEHVSDKFWLLGIGSINCKGSNTNSYFKDQNYDTNRYSETFNSTDIWNSESSHIRKVMNENGSEGSPCYWWLRSAYSYNSYNVGFVYSDGSVRNYYAYDSLGVLPACTIG